MRFIDKCEKTLKEATDRASIGDIEDALLMIRRLNLPAIIEVAFNQVVCEQYKEHIKEQGRGELMVYFLQSEETGNIKIGKTRKDIKTRMMQIHSLIPDQVRVIKYVVDKTGTLEERLHKKFKHIKLKNKKEWFAGEKELIEYIGTL